MEEADVPEADFPGTDGPVEHTSVADKAKVIEDKIKTSQDGGAQTLKHQ